MLCCTLKLFYKCIILQCIYKKLAPGRIFIAHAISWQPYFGTSIDVNFFFFFFFHLQGLHALHESGIHVHGKLKSSNAVIDSRWSCKLTDYGADHFTRDQEEDEELSEHAKYTSN